MTSKTLLCGILFALFVLPSADCGELMAGEAELQRQPRDGSQASPSANSTASAKRLSEQARMNWISSASPREIIAAYENAPPEEVGRTRDDDGGAASDPMAGYALMAESLRQSARRVEADPAMARMHRKAAQYMEALGAARPDDRLSPRATIRAWRSASAEIQAAYHALKEAQAEALGVRDRRADPVSDTLSRMTTREIISAYQNRESPEN